MGDWLDVKAFTSRQSSATYLVRYTMFGAAFRTLDLSTDVIDEAVHTRLHAEAVLAWQELRISVSIQADRAG